MSGLAPAFAEGGITLYQGDCIEVMRDLPDASVHAVVTDPPYGIDFMGKDWDSAVKLSGGMLGLIAKGNGPAERGPLAKGGTHSQGYANHDGIAFEAWVTEWARECLRILKPGGHLLAFGGSRTWHRLAAGIEDAGFEIRDSIAWMYGTGFPKSMDVAKQIDKAAGFVGEVVGTEQVDVGIQGGSLHTGRSRDLQEREVRALSPEAEPWKGWGTALKPAFEPIVVARKPLVGTVVQNVLGHGTGGLNIDATRVAFASEADEQESKAKNQHAKFGTEPGGNQVYGDYSMVERKDYDAEGRHTPNVVLDASQADELDRQSGASVSRVGKPRSAAPGEGWGMTATGREYADSGGASRFFPVFPTAFRYEAKAPTHERPKEGEIAHPTVKPLDLMRWLVRLVTPPGGVILEPFAGSGTTLEAAVREGFDCIGIEREQPYVELCIKRLRKDHQQSLFGDWDGAA